MNSTTFGKDLINQMILFGQNRNLLLLSSFTLIRNVLYVGPALFALYLLNLKAGTLGLGFVFFFSFCASTSASLIGGILADKFGRRNTLLTVSIFSSLCFFGLAIISSWIEALVLISVLSLLQSAGQPAYVALTADCVKEKETGGALGMLNALTSLAMVLGSLLAAIFVQTYFFSTVFSGMAILRLFGTIPLLFIKTFEAKTKKMNKPKTSGSQFISLMKENTKLLLLSSYVLMTCLLGYASLFYPDYLQVHFGAGAFNVGMFDAIYNVVWAVSNYPAGYISDKIGRRKIVALGFSLMGFAWLFFAHAENLIILYMLFLIYSLGNSMGYFSTVLAMELVPDDSKSVAVGVFNAFMNVGGASGSLIGGVLWNALGANYSFYLSFAAYMLSAFLIFSSFPMSMKTGGTLQSYEERACGESKGTRPESKKLSCKREETC